MGKQKVLWGIILLASGTIILVCSLASNLFASACNPGEWQFDRECMPPTVTFDYPSPPAGNCIYGSAGCGVAPGKTCSGSGWETAHGGKCKVTPKAENEQIICRDNAAQTKVEIRKFYRMCLISGQVCACRWSSSVPPVTDDVDVCTCEELQ